MLIDEINRREMGFFECLVMGKDIYVKTFREILKVVIFIGIPINFAVVMASSAASSLNINIAWEDIIAGGTAFEEFIKSGGYRNFLLYHIVISILQGILYPLITMSIARMAKNFSCGIEVRAEAAIGEAFQKGWVLILASILYQFIILTGTMFFIIPGIMFQIFFFFYIYAIMLDDKGIFQCLKYSRSLVKGYFGKTFLTSILVVLINYCLIQTVGLIFSGIPVNYLTRTFVSSFASVLDCFVVVALTIYYLNRQALKKERDRFEGFI